MNQNALQTLLDKQEISELVGPRYAQALDWLDVQMLRNCFHPDAHVDYGSYTGLAWPWCNFIISHLEKTIHRFHYVLNTQIKIEGDKAEVESNSLSGSLNTTPNKPASQDEYRFFGSRYIDQVERRENVWKLSNRIVRLDFMQTSPADTQSGGSLPGLAFLTKANRQHPLYRSFYVAPEII